MHFYARQKTFQRACSLHPGTGFGEPDRPAFHAVPLHVRPDVLQDFGKIPERTVGVDVEDVEVFRRSVFHYRIGVRQERSDRKTADCYRRFGISGPEAE